jgi:NAD(P)-dependent dehydrogenase (short-subunit alcohol dehydrogenase family)
MFACTHVLVVGGSGMLSELTIALLERGGRVSCIGRSPRRHARIAATADERFLPLAVDYRDTDCLASELQRARSTLGPVSHVIAWIHDPIQPVLQQILESVGSMEHEVDLLVILGSAAADPSRKGQDLEQLVLPFPNVRYREVILGFVLQGSSSRWLTHDEISQGVLHAFDSGERSSTVGVTSPWGRRP